MRRIRNKDTNTRQQYYKRKGSVYIHIHAKGNREEDKNVIDRASRSLESFRALSLNNNSIKRGSGFPLWSTSYGFQ